MTQADIIALLEERGEMTTQELADAMNVQLRYSNLYRKLRALLRWGDIERLPARGKKGGSSYKYRLKARDGVVRS